MSTRRDFGKNPRRSFRNGCEVVRCTWRRPSRSKGSSPKGSSRPMTPWSRMPNSASRLTTVWSRPPASAAQTAIRYTDLPAAVGLSRRTHGVSSSRALACRSRRHSVSLKATPPVSRVPSNFQPPSVRRITSRCNRPPSSAVERPIRYTDFPAAVGPMLRRSTQGSLKLAGRLPQEDAMNLITPPATGFFSDFRPPALVRITSGWSRPPSSAAQPPIR